jgi:hypothetical protein
MRPTDWSSDTRNFADLRFRNTSFIARYRSIKKPEKPRLLRLLCLTASSQRLRRGANLVEHRVRSPLHSQISEPHNAYLLPFAPSSLCSRIEKRDVLGQSVRSAPETWRAPLCAGLRAPGLSLAPTSCLGAHLGWVIHTEIPIRDIGSHEGTVIVGKGGPLIKLTASPHLG